MTTPKAPKELSQQRRHARSRALAQAVVAAISERLQDELEKNNGHLTIHNVRQLNTDFLEKTAQLTGLFELAMMESEREQDQLKWSSVKRPPFERLLVKRFESLLYHREPDGHLRGSISRRLLPGFFVTVNMMIGLEKLEFYHKRSEMALDRVMKGRLPVNWDLVDSDPEIHDIILDAQLTIAESFANTKQRLEWFLHIVNANLGPAKPGARDEDWELGPRTAHHLMHSLLQDLKKALTDDLAWRHLLERNPDANRTQFQETIDHFD